MSLREPFVAKSITMDEALYGIPLSDEYQYLPLHEYPSVILAQEMITKEMVRQVNTHLNPVDAKVGDFCHGIPQRADGEFQLMPCLAFIPDRTEWLWVESVELWKRVK